LVTIWPWPLHLPHVFAIEKNPCWKRIWPEPLHCGQVCGVVPGLAPLPPQVSQRARRGMESVFSQP
jgi:hypothetical protein